MNDDGLERGWELNGGAIKRIIDSRDNAEAKLIRLEGWLRGYNAWCQRVHTVAFGDGVELAWSGVKNRRWRFVVRDGDDVVPLTQCPDDEITLAFTSGAIAQLIGLVTDQEIKAASR